jgi:putative FmdB family regulatory protein
MPIYEYRCPTCGSEKEQLQRADDPAPDCGPCGAPMVRVLSVPGAPVVGSSAHESAHAPCCGEVGGCGRPGRCCGGE